MSSPCVFFPPSKCSLYTYQNFIFLYAALPQRIYNIGWPFSSGIFHFLVFLLPNLESNHQHLNSQNF